MRVFHPFSLSSRSRSVICIIFSIYHPCLLVSLSLTFTPPTRSLSQFVSFRLFFPTDNKVCFMHMHRRGGYMGTEQIDVSNPIFGGNESKCHFSKKICPNNPLACHKGSLLLLVYATTINVTQRMLPTVCFAGDLRKRSVIFTFNRSKLFSQDLLPHR